ncbi:hypothetical protein [Streptomyces sp. C]|uniref:hypothetical protein n=1 Tax=Streptomyces sp. C TaxID=253839 RepID=UPI0001B53624|nr:hypothetical protein [Streptomyces sp. C]EFL12919.1 predicted protein [Streptomyces sp. C]
MTNRTALSLAVGAGYFLGRTKKARLALGLTTLVLGRRAAAGSAGHLVGGLRDHPRVKELRDQVRTDLRGVAPAAVGALVDRQLDALADRLHDRTLDLQDRLAALTGRDDDTGRHATDADPEAAADADADEPGNGGAGEPQGDDRRPPRKRAARKQAPSAGRSRRSGSGTAKGAASGSRGGGAGDA